MTVHTLTVVAAFACALQALLGAVSMAAAVRIRRAAARRPDGRLGAVGGAGDGSAAQALFLPGVVLAFLSVASIPLLYLLLRSWVPQWPDAMCVRGIVRIGTGSDGLPGLLPSLLAALVATKPLVVFAAGAWLLVHLADRRTAAGPLAGRVVALLGAAGAVALLDAAAEGAYLLIPKVEPAITRGCCNTAGLVPGGDGVSEHAGLVASALAGTALAAAAAFAAARALVSSRASMWLSAASAACAVATVATGAEFLSGVLGPSRLRLPFHGCAHCLLDAAPEYAVGIALALAGAWCAGWAAVVSAAARGTAAEDPARALCGRLLAVASFALPAAAVVGLSGWWFA